MRALTAVATTRGLVLGVVWGNKNLRRILSYIAALIHLDMVALVLLHLLRKGSPFQTSLLCDRAEALLHAGLHTFQTAHVDVGLGGLHELPEIFCILCHLRLDVHLLPSRILLFARDRIVVAELVWVLCCVLRVLVIIEQRVGVWHTHEEPREAL